MPKYYHQKILEIYLNEKLLMEENYSINYETSFRKCKATTTTSENLLLLQFRYHLCKINIKLRAQQRKHNKQSKNNYCFITQYNEEKVNNLY